MVKGRSLTPAERRRLQAKIRAAQVAEADRDAYLLELSDDGVSAQTLESGSGDGSDDTRVPRSTLHRWVLRAREAADDARPDTATSATA